MSIDGYPRSRSATEHDPARLGVFNGLQGLWSNVGSNAGRGWNIIALPFVDEANHVRDYRLLINHYEEELRFTYVDDGVPNRGIAQRSDGVTQTDQVIVALDYQQTIRQLAAADSSKVGSPNEPVNDRGDEPESGVPIHHEPGLFLRMTNFQTNGFDIARLATVPHGNAATAIGWSSNFRGPPLIADIDAFPIGVADDVAAAVELGEDDYLLPYKHFVDKPFGGQVPDPKFPGFSPSNANALLQDGIPYNVSRTTKFEFDTSLEQAGITNIPFIVKQAEATLMKSTFWLMELSYGDLMLAYSQYVLLDFFPRRDGRPGRIRWPHISINLMSKVAEPTDYDPYMVHHGASTGRARNEKPSYGQ